MVKRDLQPNVPETPFLKTNKLDKKNVNPMKVYSINIRKADTIKSDNEPEILKNVMNINSKKE